MRKNKGITLLALAITIILLLILAGVVLNLTIRRKWNDTKSIISKRRIRKCK